jgi:hypothetical protein
MVVRTPANLVATAIDATLVRTERVHPLLYIAVSGAVGCCLAWGEFIDRAIAEGVAAIRVARAGGVKPSAAREQRDHESEKDGRENGSWMHVFGPLEVS